MQNKADVMRLGLGEKKTTFWSNYHSPAATTTKVATLAI